MEFRDNYKIDTSNVRYGGGSGRRGGRGIAVGGGIGGLVLALLAMLFLPNLGIDPADVLGGGQNGSQGAPADQVPGAPDCDNVTDIDQNPDCRWPAYATAMNNYWETKVDGYRPAVTQLYQGTINTACGQGTSQMGPFYCPGDEQVYIDTDFMGKLLEMLGAEGGYPAEAYIMAHEYGHHIQHITGQMQKARQGAQTGAGSGPVRLELQADCYAGVWFHNDMNDPNGLVEGVTVDDLANMHDAAHAVGDDHIQEQQTGHVIEENWTHGSSAQRQKWLRTGLETGDPAACDTFSTNDLG